jgi:general stress protein YciG
MSGTKAGAKRAVATNKAKDKDYYSKLGEKAGKVKVAKGYSMAQPQDRVDSGRKGANKRWGNEEGYDTDEI